MTQERMKDLNIKKIGNIFLVAFGGVTFSANAADLRKLADGLQFMLRADVPSGDAVHALICEVAPPPLVVSETAVRQLRPLLEELTRRRRTEAPCPA
jgi:predicted short-subunit dehydrogenase-like oxidoreductase (DUF2520 family)